MKLLLLLLLVKKSIQICSKDSINQFGQTIIIEFFNYKSYYAFHSFLKIVLFYNFFITNLLLEISSFLMRQSIIIKKFIFQSVMTSIVKFVVSPLVNLNGFLLPILTFSNCNTKECIYIIKCKLYNTKTRI